MLPYLKICYLVFNKLWFIGACFSLGVEQVAFAARGQTISVAFYPEMGIVTYGSEAAATKAPLTVVPAGHRDKLLQFFEENDPSKVCGTRKRQTRLSVRGRALVRLCACVCILGGSI